MSDVWLVVLLAGVATVALKSVGPVLVGGRDLPPLVLRLVELLAPALLAAFVAVQTFGGDRELVLDPRIAGLGAAIVALAARLPLVVVVVAAAATTAAVRALA